MSAKYTASQNGTKIHFPKSKVRKDWNNFFSLHTNYEVGRALKGGITSLFF